MITLKQIGSPVEDLSGELWAYVPDTSNRYLISTAGRLLTTAYKGGKRHSIMLPAKEKGYCKTVLKFDYGYKGVSIHRLVAQSFIPKPENKPQVNHIDFDGLNNNLSNLEWVTGSENTLHSYNAGRIKKPVCTNFVKGSKIGTSKLTEEMVREIRRKFKPRVYTRKMLGEEYGVSPATIKDAILRRWKHVTND